MNLDIVKLLGQLFIAVVMIYLWIWPWFFPPRRGEMAQKSHD